MTSRFFRICSDGQWRPSEVDRSLVFWPRFQLVSLSCSDAKRYKEKKHEEGGKKKKRREMMVVNYISRRSNSVVSNKINQYLSYFPRLMGLLVFVHKLLFWPIFAADLSFAMTLQPKAEAAV